MDTLSRAAHRQSPGERVTWFNFLAWHDGRWGNPARILSDAEIAALIARASRRMVDLSPTSICRTASRAVRDEH
jgi:hypothetical protein